MQSQCNLQSVILYHRFVSFVIDLKELHSFMFVRHEKWEKSFSVLML